MENVYDIVSSFYWEEPDMEAIVARREVERFLRKRAWQGESAGDLLDTWFQMQSLFEYVLTIAPVTLDELTADEYSRAIQYIGDQTDDPVTLEEAIDLFEVWHDFYEQLADDKLIDSLDALEMAQMRMTEGEEIGYVEPVSFTDKVNLMQADLAYADPEPAEFNQFLGHLAEGLLLKMSAFFQGKEFTRDLERALYLYAGPFLDIVTEKDANFWQGFWDFFLFDYHLIKTDRTPIALFGEKMYEVLDVEEQRIYSDWEKMRFSLFEVVRVQADDWVVCQDLFTDETFALPKSVVGRRESYEECLFYGHIRINGVVMVNHVVRVEATPALRRRIRAEILHQLRLFQCAYPEAELDDLFLRHVASVRHLIDILCQMRTVTVMSSTRLSEMRAVGEGMLTLALAKEIDVLVPMLSLYDKRQIGKMCIDYQALAKPSLILDREALIAMVGVFLQLNHSRFLSVEEAIAGEVDWTASDAKQNLIIEELNITPFDARYLNEEGFIYSLFIL